MRFVHSADWQLGMTRHFLAGEAQPRYSAARRDAVAGLGALAAQAGAEFVVVSGDVFEDNQLAPTVISQSLEAMRAIGTPLSCSKASPPGWAPRRDGGADACPGARNLCEVGRQGP